MSKCKNYNACKNAEQEARLGEVHKCPHGKLFWCIKSSSWYCYAWAERLSPFRNPVRYVKARKELGW